MQLRLTTSRCDRGLEQNAGDVIDVELPEARRLLAAGLATTVEPTVDRATRSPIENTSHTHLTRKRGK